MAFELAPDRKVTRDRAGYAEALRAAVEFRVDVTRERGEVRVRPVGDIDLATVGRLILDLRATTFLDSTALHLTVETHDRAARTGTELAIIPGAPAVQRTFEAAGLSARLPFVDVPRG